MSYAVDFGWGRPTPNQITAAGASGVLRYISQDPTKCIGAAEAADYLHAGLPFGLVYEDGAMDFSVSGQGIIKARIAAPLLMKFTFPKDRPVYCAVDGNLATDLYEKTYQEVHNFCSALGRPDAIYGPRPFLYYCWIKHGVKWTWEVGSGSFNVGPEPTNKRLQQLVLKKTINGTDVDEDTILMADWGQFPGPSAPKVIVAAVVKKLAPPIKKHKVVKKVVKMLIPAAILARLAAMPSWPFGLPGE